MLLENRSSGAATASIFRKPKISVRCRNDHKNRPLRTVYSPSHSGSFVNEGHGGFNLEAVEARSVGGSEGGNVDGNEIGEWV